MLNSTQLTSDPTLIFITKSNTWYIAVDGVGQVFSGVEYAMNPPRPRYGGYGIFVATNSDMYSYDEFMSQVNTWSVNTTNSHPVMFISGRCEDLFIDQNNTLYCALHYMHRIIAKSLDDPTNTLRLVAGTDCPGAASYQLWGPSGIFVGLNFSLFVADSNNNRIQRFDPDKTNATTVAGNGMSGSIFLSLPSDVILDGDGYLFIVDSHNNRIIGSGPKGYRCVAGCMNTSGSASNQLLHPRSMSFDSYGNIWVTDCGNSRVQKFVLASNSCGTFRHTVLCNE